MADEPNQVLPNDPASRTETGELKNLTETTKAAETTDTQTKTPEELAAEAAKATGDKDKDGNTLLTKKDEKTEEAKGAPEKYEDFNLPEGVQLEEKALGEATALFKELGIPQGEAQKLIDFHTAQLKAAAEAPMTAYQAYREEGQKAVYADKEVGTGTGLKPEVKATIGRALDQLGDAALVAEFRKDMDHTGVGDRVSFIKVINRLAQAFTEGKGVGGKGPSGLGQKDPSKGPVSMASAMYPNLPSSSR